MSRIRNGIIRLFTKLLLGISASIFRRIEDLYRMFYGLATTKLFTEETIRNVSNNIYILVSVVILFAFAVKLIEAIVVPDLLTDSKKGVTGVLKRTIIGLLLIVAIPNIFNLAYYLQAEVIAGSLVEKIILGYTDRDASVSSTGGILTSSIITGFVYPIDENGKKITQAELCGEDAQGNKIDCNFSNELVNLNPDYEEYVSLMGGNPDYGDLSSLNIGDEWDNGEDIYSVDAIFLLAVGLYVLYQIILLCFDTALRLVNLGLLEIMAPIIIVSYIAGGEQYLSKWAKMTLSKFMSVFIRIAALAFMILGLTLMRDEKSIFNNGSVTFMFQLLVIIGLLRLIKDLPNIINGIFGVKYETGGIKSRLGEMAGVGDLAQKAWSGMGGLAKTAGLALGGAVVAGDKLVRRGIAGTRFGKSKIGSALIQEKNLASRFAQTRFGKRVVGAGKVAVAGYKSGGKGTTKAVLDSYKENFGDKAYLEEKREKKEKKRRIVHFVTDNTHGAVVVNNEGKVDYEASVNNMISSGTNAYDVNENMLKTVSLQKASKDSLHSLNKAHYNALREQNRMKNREALISQVSSISSMLVPGDQLGAQAVSEIVENVKQGLYTNPTALKNDLDAFVSTGRVEQTTIDRIIDSYGYSEGAVSHESYDALAREAEKSNTEYNEAKKSAEELKDKLVGTEKDAFDLIFKTSEKLTESEFDRRVGDQHDPNKPVSRSLSKADIDNKTRPNTNK